MGYSPKGGKVSWLFEYLELMLLILRSSLGGCVGEGGRGCCLEYGYISQKLAHLVSLSLGAGSARLLRNLTERESKLRFLKSSVRSFSKWRRMSMSLSSKSTQISTR